MVLIRVVSLLVNPPLSHSTCAQFTQPARSTSRTQLTGPLLMMRILSARPARGSQSAAARSANVVERLDRYLPMQVAVTKSRKKAGL